MTPANPPAERYLHLVGSLVLGAPQGEGDAWRARLREHLEGLWSRGQEELRHLERKEEGAYSGTMESRSTPGPAAGEPRGVRVGLFVTAVGLFALGRLDVAPFIARYAGAPTQNLLRLGQVLRELLPLPAAPEEGPWTRERIAAWLDAHSAELRWDEVSRRYLSSS